MKKRGLIIVYTGDGKGKTTASLGLALRAVGSNMRVLFMQFIKLGKCGEHKALENIKNIEIVSFGKGFCNIYGDNLPFSDHKQEAKRAFDFATEALKSNKYDMIILDEINCALNCKLLKVKDVLEMLKIKPPELHLVLTGRNAHKSIIKKADLVSEIKEIKHHYRKGIMAQKGIEF